MIRYGIKTWKSIAMPAVLFLAVAVFLWISAMQIQVSVNREVAAYGKITCTLDDAADRSTAESLLLQYNGSPVYELQAVLQSVAVQKEYSVTGIESRMIPGTLRKGTYYSDDNSTLAIVINQAAFLELTGTGNQKEDEQASLVGHTLIMGNSGAKICGIVEDASDTPALYISIPAAKSYMQQSIAGDSGNLSNSTGANSNSSIDSIDTTKEGMYWIRTSNLNDLLNIRKQMKSLGITTNVDENQIMQWREQQIRQNYDILMGFLALAGYVSCIVLSVQKRKYQEEPQRPRVHMARLGMSVIASAGIGILAKYLMGLWI